MTYWDTSAIIFFLAQGRLAKISGVTRPHTLAEFYSRTTGKGFVSAGKTVKLKPSLAADCIVKLAERLQFVNLNEQETVQALTEASKVNATGGKIHDLLHIAAALKAKADDILTCNTRDFEGFSPVPLKHPASATTAR